jgi:zona occludens toxin (predicted ATPase)
MQARYQSSLQLHACMDIDKILRMVHIATANVAIHNRPAQQRRIGIAMESNRREWEWKDGDRKGWVTMTTGWTFSGIVIKEDTSGEKSDVEWDWGTLLPYVGRLSFGDCHVA